MAATSVQIEPQFNLELGQPFLYRPLHDVEIEITWLWIDFVNNPPEELKGKRISDFEKAFKTLLTEKGYPNSLTRASNGDRSNQAFQELFIARNTIDVVTAVRKLSGCDGVLTPIEKRLAFREAVEYYRSINTDPDKPLPTLEDFDRYNAQGLYLPNTGVICPSRSAFCRPAKPFSTKTLFVYYTQFFSIPKEISIDELRTILPMKFAIIRDVVEKIKVYRKDVQNELGITLPNLTVNRPGSDHELMQIATKTSVLFRQIDIHDEELMDMLIEFAMRYGKLDVVVPEDQRLPQLKIITKIPRRKSVPQSEATLDVFCKIWKQINPNGFDPEAGVLIDPPSATLIKHYRDIQNKLMLKHGELPEQECKSLKVPIFLVPTTGEIDKYKAKCGGRGYTALLRDIEDQVFNNGDFNITEILENDDGIVFENSLQLAQLKKHFKALSLPNIDYVPRALVRAMANFLRGVPGQIEIVDVDAHRKRLSNLEAIMLREWAEYSAKVIKIIGKEIPLTDMQDRFIRHLEKSFDQRLFVEGLDPTMRLFQGTSASGEQLSFMEGLLQRLNFEIAPKVELQGPGLGNDGMHFVESRHT